MRLFLEISFWTRSSTSSSSVRVFRVASSTSAVASAAVADSVFSCSWAKKGTFIWRLLLLDTDALEADGANAEHVDDVARRTAVVERNFIVVFVFGVLVLCCERGG